MQSMSKEDDKKIIKSNPDEIVLKGHSKILEPNERFGLGENRSNLRLEIWSRMDGFSRVSTQDQIRSKSRT